MIIITKTSPNSPDGGFYADFQYYDTERFGVKIFENDYPVAKLAKAGAGHLLNLNFEDRLQQFNGIYVIEVRDKERNFVTNSKIIAYSDIGLIAKREKDRIFVFANTISEAQPISGVNVSLISTNNQKVLNAVTDADGLAMFTDLSKSIADFTVGMVTAQRGNDFNYLYLTNTQVSTERYEVGGRYGNETDYEAFIYGERDIYRPGETMNVGVVVRKTDWTVPGQIPIRISLVLPNGKEYLSVRKNLNADGATETAIQLPVNVVTGTYHVEVYTGDDKLLNTQNISVEEFMPDRIKVEVKPDKTEVGAGETITVNGTRHQPLWPPATDRSVQVEMKLEQGQFKPKGLENFLFETKTDKSFGNKLSEGKTDANGNFSFKFDIPKEYADVGLLNGRFYTTVFDESGSRLTDWRSLKCIHNRISTASAPLTIMFPLVNHSTCRSLWWIKKAHRKRLRLPLRSFATIGAP